MLPKVVEALLGTRFMGRNFTKNPLVSLLMAQCCNFQQRIADAQKTSLFYPGSALQVAGSRNTLAVDADGQILSWGWNARGTLGHGHGYAQLHVHAGSALDVPLRHPAWQLLVSA